VPDSEPRDKFTGLLKRLVRVPKREIDEREREYKDSRKTVQPAKPREIVPRERRRQGEGRKLT
jgi:hypothetical protein